MNILFIFFLSQADDDDHNDNGFILNLENNPKTPACCPYTEISVQFPEQWLALLLGVTLQPFDPLHYLPGNTPVLYPLSDPIIIPFIKYFCKNG